MKARCDAKVILAVLITVFVSACSDQPVTHAQTDQGMSRAIQQWKNVAANANRDRRNPSNPRVARVWDELDAETNSSTGKTPITRVTNYADRQEWQIYTDWLQWRVVASNADGRFSYAYALNLNHLRDDKGQPQFRRETAVFFFNARLALQIDGARCASASRVEEVTNGYESQTTFKGMLAEISAMSNRERAEAMLDAAALEEFRGERQRLAFLCQPEKEGGTVVRLRSDNEWQQARRDLLDGWIRSARKQGRNP
jgi:hypothetical protein